jgi:hypothetical protein
MFEDKITWAGYKSWQEKKITPELLWTHTTADEIITQFRTEWKTINRNKELPTTYDYLDDGEKIASLKAVSTGITAYTDPGAVNYKINSMGFRGDWDLVNNDNIKLGFFGCSFTYGVGIAEEDLYVTLLTNALSKKLGKSCKAYNCGVPGGSTNKATRYYAMLSNFIKFDYVICLMPHTGRAEYPILEQNKGLGWNIIPNWKDLDSKSEWLRLQFYKTIDENFLNSDFIRNINHCENIAKAHNSKIYFTSWDQNTYEYLYNYYINRDLDKLLPWWQALEYEINPRMLLGRDGIHPGPRSHLEFSKRALEYIK